MPFFAPAHWSNHPREAKTSCVILGCSANTCLPEGPLRAVVARGVLCNRTGFLKVFPMFVPSLSW